MHRRWSSSQSQETFATPRPFFFTVLPCLGRRTRACWTSRRAGSRPARFSRNGACSPRHARPSGRGRNNSKVRATNPSRSWQSRNPTAGSGRSRASPRRYAFYPPAPFCATGQKSTLLCDGRVPLCRGGVVVVKFNKATKTAALIFLVFYRFRATTTTSTKQHRQ